MIFFQEFKDLHVICHINVFIIIISLTFLPKLCLLGERHWKALSTKLNLHVMLTTPLLLSYAQNDLKVNKNNVGILFPQELKTYSNTSIRRLSIGLKKFGLNIEEVSLQS